MGELATGGITEQMISNLVTSRWDESEEFHRKFKSKVRDWYNLYRCIYTGDKLPFKNVVMLPLLFSACWSDVANKAAISFSSGRIVEFQANHPDAGPSAKRAEALINQQFLDSDIMEKMIDFLMSADIYGTGVLQYGWRKKVTPYTYRREALGIAYPETVPITEFDGPDFFNVDILDFAPQPGKKTIETMNHACIRYYADLDDLMDEAFIAQQEGEDGRFDLEGLQRLQNQPPGKSVINEYNERKQVWRSYSEYEAIRREKYAKPVELIDMVGMVPSDFAPDGYRLRIMTVANRNVPLRNVPSPYPAFRKHFRSYSPMPDPHYFHGTGKVEIGATLASSGNKLVSNRLDILDLYAQPAMFISDQTEVDTQNLVLWPGRIIKVHGETGESQIRPLQWDLQAYPLIVNEMEAISQYIDMATGVQRDVIQGALSNDRQTAREFLGRMEQARTRLGLEAKLFERSIVEKLADDYRMLDRWFLPLPQMVSLIGSSALVDPDTGAPLSPSLEPVTLPDLNADHSIRAIGSSEFMSKSMKRQDMMTALQAVSSNPAGMMTTNWMAFFSKFWRAFDFDPYEMMMQHPAFMNAAMAMGMLQQGGEGGQGPAAGGPTGDVLAQLSPEILGQQGPESPIPNMSMMGFDQQQNFGQ